MNFPSLPTDSIYKFLCISGIVLNVFCESNIQENTNKYHLGVGDYKRKISSIQLISDSKISQLKADVEQEEKQIALLKSTLHSDTKGQFDMKEFEKKINVDRSKSKTTIDSLNSLGQKMDSEAGNEKDNLENLDWTIWRMRNYEIISYILIGVGLIGWLFVQRHQDKIFQAQYVEALKDNVPCQSCGMLLKFDKSYKIGNRYCSHCYTGQDFVNPTLTLKELKEEIRVKMKSQGISKIDIWLYLKKLDTLTRWEKAFKW